MSEKQKLNYGGNWRIKNDIGLINHLLNGILLKLFPIRKEFEIGMFSI